MDSVTYALFCSWNPIQVAFSKKLGMPNNRFLLGVFHTQNMDFDYWRFSSQCPKQPSKTVTMSLSGIFICSENHRRERMQMSFPPYTLPNLGNIYLARDQEKFFKVLAPLLVQDMKNGDEPGGWGATAVLLKEQDWWFISWYCPLGILRRLGSVKRRSGAIPFLAMTQ